MDFDDAKENIQPLVQGRNASILQASLNVDSPQELLAQRRELEKEIHNYSGDDPLSVWYNYIDWIEQSCPSGGKESGLHEVLSKCLSKFEGDERYSQDRRMIKLYIKFIDCLKDPAECYQQLFNAGIGTMVADFYIAWAYCYDLAGNTRRADEVFRRGLSCRAQPLEDLQEAHQHFGFSVAQRLMYKDDDTVKEETNRQLHERRLALTSLRGHRKKQKVGSIRTGSSAVKSVMPGTIKIDQPSTSQRGNERINVFNDENNTLNLVTKASTDPSEEGKSIVRSIIDAARDQENQKEPGPWSKAHFPKKGKLFGKTTIVNDLGFEIHEDQDDVVISERTKNLCIPPINIAVNEVKFDKPFIYPQHFCAKSRPIQGWLTPVTTEEKPDKNTIPQYNKCKLYPRPNMEFQPEELKAYCILKKRGIKNVFTEERDIYWGCGPDYSIRLYPHFAKLSKQENIEANVKIYIPDKTPGLLVVFKEIYNKEENIERQFEEILGQRIKRNETITKTTDMEETMCITSEKIQRRKSFFPIRKSLAPSALKVSSKMPAMEEQNDIGVNYLSHKLTQSQPTKENSFETQLINLGDKLVSQQSIEADLRKETNLHNPVKISTDEMLQDIGEKNSPMIGTPVVQGNDFQFKTPSLPPINPAPITSNKIQFEIFEDENLMAKPDTCCETGYFFDPEETCSTQTFNIFLKAQSVSTPKALHKSQPQRQFGNVLKELTAIPEKKEDQQQLSADTDNPISAVGAVTAPAYSPPRQQLSTILETSEHGTTQGTHTTGATTKSTFSSPEFDLEHQIQATAASQQQPPLEPVKELSCESSFITSPKSCLQNVNKLMDSMKIQNLTENITKAQREDLATPGVTRLQKKAKSNGLDFSIFNDESANDEKKVGNFSRLEEKEYKDADYAFNAIPQIRFQDEKTETITKDFITSQRVNFQDDKTETISKMLFPPTLSIQFPEDKTETISNLLLGPPQEDLKSKDFVSESQPTKEDDSFEFFGHTPPKATKNLFCKQSERAPFSQMRTASNLLSPLILNSKRFCEKDTPELQKFKSKSSAIFESEADDPFIKSFNKEDVKISNNSDIIKKNPTTELSRTTNLQQSKSNFIKSKSIFRDSFIPDFSIIEDFQGVSKNINESNIKPTANSFKPEFSLSENKQPKLVNLADISFVPETQADASIIKSSQPIEEPKILKQNIRNSNLQSSFNDSKRRINESKANDNIHWKQTPNPKSVSNTTQDGTSLKNILMDNFMKDFSEISELPSTSKDKKEKLMEPSKSNNSLRFLSESIKNKPLDAHKSKSEKISTNLSMPTGREPKLSFLSPASPDKNSSKEKRSAGIDNDKYFELNCETEMFGTNISMIKNSTWLPNHGPTSISNNNKQMSQIQENSIHIKQEEILSNSFNLSSTLKDQQNNKLEDFAKPNADFAKKSLCNNNFSIEISASELAAINEEKLPTNTVKSIVVLESPDIDECEMSIYYKKTPKTPKPQIHIWNDEDELKSHAHNHYIHAEADLNQTNHIIESMCIDPNVNPFNVDLINAFLEQHYVISYLEKLPTCKLIGCVQRLKPNATINIKGVNFKVLKLVGEGAYGAIFCGKELDSEKLVAMKQEKPPNYWEYYICLEIQERIRVDEMLPAYMSIDHALIGNNSSILISNFSQYGSLISVCNKIKKYTMKNVDEYVVMLMASELLEIIDHLHAVNIIHADIKADNFLLMKKITYPPTERCLQLIDFGVSIDMKLFKQGQVFNFIHSDNAFKCPEMREKRPWTYQLDLFGLAGVFHVLLFGKYMDIQKDRGFWMHKSHVPRYLNKILWDDIFKTLLNIRDCNSMPNLQDLRAMLKKELEEKEKYVIRMVNEFNKALTN